MWHIVTAPGLLPTAALRGREGSAAQRVGAVPPRAKQRGASTEGHPINVEQEVARTQPQPRAKGHDGATWPCPIKGPLMDTAPTNRARPHQQAASDPSARFAGFKRAEPGLSTTAASPAQP